MPRKKLLQFWLWLSFIYALVMAIFAVFYLNTLLIIADIVLWLAWFYLLIIYEKVRTELR